MKTTKLVLCLITSVLVSTSSFAQSLMSKEARKTELHNLTEAQRSQIKNIKESEKKEVLNLHNQLREKQAQLRTHETAAKPDMKLIHKTIEEKGAIHTKMEKMKAEQHQKVREVLTPEQKTAYDAKHIKKQEKRYLKKEHLKHHNKEEYADLSNDNDMDDIEAHELDMEADYN